MREQCLEIVSRQFRRNVVSDTPEKIPGQIERAGEIPTERLLNFPGNV
jgi:hypothetical protein